MVWVVCACTLGSDGRDKLREESSWVRRNSQPYPGDGSNIYFVIFFVNFLSFFLSFQFCLSFCLSFFCRFFCHFSFVCHLFCHFFVVFLSFQFRLSFFCHFFVVFFVISQFCLSFFCHFSKNFSIVFTICEKIAPKRQNNDKFSTKCKNDCTFAGGKNCIFLEALSFFCHFSVIFRRIFRSFSLFLKKLHQNDKKMTNFPQNETKMTKKRQKKLHFCRWQKLHFSRSIVIFLLFFENFFDLFHYF